MWTFLNEHKTLPLYRQVINLIEHHINHGILNAGDKLPAERQLSRLLSVNRSTIIHALTELTERGILIRKIGSGTYVNNQKWGVQCYPLLNWRANKTAWITHKNDEYQKYVKQRRLEHDPQHTLIDLANGDLPNHLLPEFTLPDLSWQDLICQEQGGEMAYRGVHSLREIVKQHVKDYYQLQVGTEQILITSGAQQALFLISQCLLKPGDAIGIEACSYFYSLPIFQAAGLRLYSIPMDHEGITVEGLAQVVKQQGIKMLFINPIFQNPTGCVMSKQRKQELLYFCQQHHIPIIEDDAYSQLAFDPQHHCQPIKCYDHRHQVIYIGSLSKYIGKNIRIGWIIAPEEIIEKLAEIRYQIDSGLSLLPQLLAENYLTRYHAHHIQNLRQQLAYKAVALTDWLTEHYPQQLQFAHPLGGFHLYAHYHSRQDFNSFLFSLLKQNIIVMRGYAFGDSQPAIRLSFAHWSLP